MIKLVEEGASIECLAAEVISRNPIPSSFMKIENFRCQTYKCKRNSEATISKELEPKKAVHSCKSYLELNGKLECETLFLAVNSIKRLRFEKCAHTGRHNSQILNTKSYTFAQIIKQIPNIPKKIISQNIKLISK